MGSLSTAQTKQAETRLEIQLRQKQFFISKPECKEWGKRGCTSSDAPYPRTTHDATISAKTSKRQSCDVLGVLCTLGFQGPVALRKGK